VRERLAAGAQQADLESRVGGLLADGRWRTLDEIAHATGAPITSICAQPRFGACVVEKRGTPARVLYECRVVIGVQGDAA
jgi:hypothetical protein